jgi:hypothetical protein
MTGSHAESKGDANSGNSKSSETHAANRLNVQAAISCEAGKAPALKDKSMSCRGDTQN